MPSKLDQAKDPNASSELLEELSRDVDSWVRFHAAVHPNTPPAVLAYLSYDDATYMSHPRVSDGALRNPHMPMEVLVRMFRSDDDWDRNRVARHPNATPEMLDVLCRDSDIYVRKFAILHRNTWQSTLLVVALDPPDDNALRHLKSAPNTPPLVKMWLQGYYSDLTLEEFLEAVK